MRYIWCIEQEGITMENKKPDDIKEKDLLAINSRTEIENYFKSIDRSTRQIHTDRISIVFRLLNEIS